MRDPTRRTLLRATAGLSILGITKTGLIASALGSPFINSASAAPPATPKTHDRVLSLEHLHTGETITAVYRQNGRLDLDGVAALNRILRDWRTGEKTEMDIGLLDLIADLRDTLNLSAPFGIISGYRSPTTNSALASRSNAVATRSFHMQGKAIDIRIPGIHAANAYPVALAMKRGGVGAYFDNDFLHLDTGPVRTW